MIESLEIASIATYGKEPVILDQLREINFLFGSNGVGKTTISKIINSGPIFPECKVKWKGNLPLETMVYNRDFVARNFEESKELKGIFTLGERNVDTLAKIENLKRDIDNRQTKISQNEAVLNGDGEILGKNQLLAQLEEDLKAKCWEKKQKYDEQFREAFAGYRGKAELFKGKILSTAVSQSHLPITLEELVERGAILYKAALISQEKMKLLSFNTATALEASPILGKRVLGRDDVDVAGLIRMLGNSDWVRHGLAFLDRADDRCPFCQQAVEKNLKEKIEEFFDETYNADISAISTLQRELDEAYIHIEDDINSIAENAPGWFDRSYYDVLFEAVRSKCIINRQRVAEKAIEPSRVISLDSIADLAGDLNILIGNTNARIDEENRLVLNLKQERLAWIDQVWAFIRLELKSDVDSYLEKKRTYQAAIDGIGRSIGEHRARIGDMHAEIRKLEKTITSTQPTIDAINALLISFGFQGFRLDGDTTGARYRLIRDNGEDASLTLSEGEKTFITFLYFYHLLKGSNSESGLTHDRVVALDDPISSLDSDILFIVSTLIRQLYEDVFSPSGKIKQIFVLTHNIYFHKEVSFRITLKDRRTPGVSYWIVRKIGGVTKVDRHESNPVSTGYELMWRELRNPDLRSVTLQNTMRRILENYFKMFGGVSLDDLSNHFTGADLVVCRSLISWLHDGSHFNQDDLHLTVSEEMVANQLKVFKRIFLTKGHQAHYEMMMGVDAVHTDNLVDSISHEGINDGLSMNGIRDEDVVAALSKIRIETQEFNEPVRK